MNYELFEEEIIQVILKFENEELGYQEQLQREKGDYMFGLVKIFWMNLVDVCGLFVSLYFGFLVE